VLVSFSDFSTDLERLTSSKEHFQASFQILINSNWRKSKTKKKLIHFTERNLFSETETSTASTGILPNSMEPEVLLPCSKHSATCPMLSWIIAVHALSFYSKMYFNVIFAFTTIYDNFRKVNCSENTTVDKFRTHDCTNRVYKCTDKHLTTYMTLHKSSQVAIPLFMNITLRPQTENLQKK
jgi:hypothetical protein